MRGRPGTGGLQNAAAARNQIPAKLRTDLMEEQLATFRSQLQNSAVGSLCVFLRQERRAQGKSEVYASIHRKSSLKVNLVFHAQMFVVFLVPS
ncbi:UNVERIFIED_CONTAM: Vacuolar protein sorting-associated protein [Sesamum latifolium]|uniref:Vacuolar protein sorting-associated protein n=1 Tax=Sesamum latifolium TaxID=2727402 RepID=A0AAW2TQM2_9LAMI